MVERLEEPSDSEITRPSLRFRTESSINLVNNSSKYYSRIMTILDRVKFNKVIYEDVNGTQKIGEKIFAGSPGLSKELKSFFNKRPLQRLGLNFIYGMENRQIELTDENVGLFFVLDKKFKKCGVLKGRRINDDWEKQETDEISLDDALALAKLGEKF
jgi:hypothetical protein